MKINQTTLQLRYLVLVSAPLDVLLLKMRNSVFVQLVSNWMGLTGLNVLVSAIIFCYCFFLVQQMNTTDRDECTLSNPCEQICNNSEGSFFCSCEIGFILSANDRNCTGMYRNNFSIWGEEGC